MANNQPERRHNQHAHAAPVTDLNTPKRMRYSYGLLLDKFHFELEQQYFNNKRWLLNRRIFGPGVVCGLDVQLTQDRKGIVVLPGLAIDRCGREIIVPKQSKPISLPFHVSPEEQKKSAANQASWSQATPYGDVRHRCDDEWAHVVLCYHECASDPVPILVGNCETEDPCAASAIREQYTISWRDGRAPEVRSEFPDIIEGRRINHDALVEYITRPCRRLPDDCCIALANVRVRQPSENYEPSDIYINARRVVYSLPVLFELIKSLVHIDQSDY